MKILCIGFSAYDITFPIDGFLIENSKNRSKERIECGGGPASNAAYLLGKWDCDVSFMGVVGNDEYGRKIKKELDNVNVNTEYLELSSDYQTPTAFIVVNKKTGSRTVLTYREDEMKLKDIDLCFEPDVILIDGQEYEMSKKILTKYPNAISIIDASRPTEQIIELSRMVNYLVCSKNFAETITNITISNNNLNTIGELYYKMKSLFNNNIVVTLEDKGVLYEYNNRVKLLSGLKQNVVDTTGAGDIFHGAFTYAISKKMDFEKAIKLANVTAGLSVTRLGGRNSVFDIEEIKELYNEFK